MSKNLNPDRIAAITTRLDDLGEGLDWLYTNRSEILAEAGPIAPGFQSDYTGRIDRTIGRIGRQYDRLTAYRDRWFPVHGPEAPVVEPVDDGWPF